MMLPIANAVLQQLKDTEMRAEMQEDQVQQEHDHGLELKGESIKKEAADKRLEVTDARPQEDTCKQRDSESDMFGFIALNPVT